MDENDTRHRRRQLRRQRDQQLEADAQRLRRDAAALRARLAAIVESSDDAIVSKDLNGIVQSWNRGAERLFGYAEAEMLGQPITVIIPEDRLHEAPHVLDQIRRGEKVDHYETVRRRKDGTLVDISLTVSPILDADGTVIGASKIARDITERKAWERSLVETDRRKDEFLATLAHELRNPLAPLTTGIELLRMNSGGSEMSAEIIDTMDRQLRHLVRLVNDLLEVSRFTRGVIPLQKENVRLESAIQAAVEIAKPLVEAGQQRLEIALPSEALVVQGDRTRLTQIVANLLNNAAKYTPPHGLIRVALERDGSLAKVRVTDNGVGIPPDKLPTIFEMFTQAHDNLSGGLGIGLALSQRLAQLHGGRIEARSEGANLGSEFVLELPLVATAQPAQDQGEHGARRNVPARRVLVVDDNADAAQNLGLLLRMLGHEVHVAENGTEALQQAETLRPDVVLLDIGMPDISGYEVARRLRAEQWGRTALIVALTGWGQEGDRQRAAASGFDHHLTKPVSGEMLERLLAEGKRSVH